MNRQSLRRLSAAFSLAVLLLACASTARADGDIAFLPSHTTFTAGDQFSWMEVGRDWDRTAVGALAGPYAVPNLPQIITVESWSTATELHLHFTITDTTTQRPPLTPGGTQLPVGDRVIIQIDPNYSGHGSGGGAPLLEIGNDHRFELVFNNDLVDMEMPMNTPLDIVNSCHKVPTAGNVWGGPQALPAGFAVTVTMAGGYDVQVTIPFSVIGLGSSPAGPIGIAFAVLNDIDHGHPDLANPMFTVHELTGSPFPSSMGLSYITDPGVTQNTLTTEDLASGPWLNPSQWATGYFSTASAGPTNDVTFTHMPDPYLSGAIRLGVCGTTTFEGAFSPSGVADWNTNQTMLHNWYQYNSGGPCSMRIWVRMNRTMPGVSAIKKRIAIFWGRPNIGGTQEWFRVVLSPPLNITAPTETFNFLWTSVSPQTFTDHPCLRVYALPETLNLSDGMGIITESFINGITTDAALVRMENAYNVPNATSPRWAQMNYTATLNGGMCPTAGGCAPATAQQRRRGNNGDETARDDMPVRIVKASFSPDADSEPADPTQKIGNDDRRNFRVFIEGYGVESTPNAKRHYAYLQLLGGIGTLVPTRALSTQGGLKFELDVTNPQFVHRDLTKSPPVNTLSPQRDVFLRVVFDLPPGMETPEYTIKLDRTRLGPGETTKGVVTVTPKGTTPVATDFKRWGFSLHAGMSIPHGNLNNLHNPGPNVGVDLEYRFKPRFSLETIYTFNRFRGETLSTTFGTFKVPDLNLHVLSLNGKVYGTTSPVRPFFNFGGGAYVFTPGATVRGGVNVGGGLQFDVTPTFAIDAMYNFHNVFGSGGSNLQYSTVQGGVRWRF